MNRTLKKKKTTDEKIDDLATAVKIGFDEVGKNIGALITKNTNEIKDEMSKGFKKVDDRLEAVELRLDNVAYRFELVELEKRVDLLEKVTGVKSKR